MPQESRSNKGVTTSFLALIIAVIALIISLFALNQSINQKAVYKEIKEMQEGLLSGTQKASERMESLVKETGKVLEEISNRIEKKGQREKEQGTTE